MRGLVAYIKSSLYSDSDFFFTWKREKHSIFMTQFWLWIEPQKCVRIQDFVSFKNCQERHPTPPIKMFWAYSIWIICANSPYLWHSGIPPLTQWKCCNLTGFCFLQEYRFPLSIKYDRENIFTPCLVIKLVLHVGKLWK